MSAHATVTATVFVLASGVAAVTFQVRLNTVVPPVVPSRFRFSADDDEAAAVYLPARNASTFVCANALAMVKRLALVFERIDDTVNKESDATTKEKIASEMADSTSVSPR